MDGCVGKWMDEWVDEWINEWVGGWVGGVCLRFADLTLHQLKYQQRTEAGWSSLFHLMAETLQTQFVREQSELLSQVAACSPPQPPPPASPAHPSVFVLR